MHACASGQYMAFLASFGGLTNIFDQPERLLCFYQQRVQWFEPWNIRLPPRFWLIWKWLETTSTQLIIEQGDCDRHRSFPSRWVQILWFYRKMVQNQHQTLIFFDTIKSTKNFWCMLPHAFFIENYIIACNVDKFQTTSGSCIKASNVICSTSTIKFFFPLSDHD